MWLLILSWWYEAIFHLLKSLNIFWEHCNNVVCQNWLYTVQRDSIPKVSTAKTGPDMILCQNWCWCETVWIGRSHLWDGWCTYFWNKLKPSMTVIWIKFWDEWRRRVSHLTGRNTSLTGKASNSLGRSECDWSPPWPRQNLFNQRDEMANNCNRTTPFPWNGQPNEQILSASDRKNKATSQPFEWKKNSGFVEIRMY